MGYEPKEIDTSTYDRLVQHVTDRLGQVTNPENELYGIPLISLLYKDLYKTDPEGRPYDFPEQFKGFETSEVLLWFLGKVKEICTTTSSMWEVKGAGDKIIKLDTKVRIPAVGESYDSGRVIGLGEELIFFIDAKNGQIVNREASEMTPYSKYTSEEWKEELSDFMKDYCNGSLDQEAISAKIDELQKHAKLIDTEVVAGDL